MLMMMNLGELYIYNVMIREELRSWKDGVVEVVKKVVG
jgi:hypothetical protein